MSNAHKWVTLLSEDGYRFIVDREWAMLSGTIRTMLSTDEGGFFEAESGICQLQIRGQVLEKVVEYLQWHARYAQHDQYPIKEFERKIPPELALELLMAADFLEL